MSGSGDLSRIVKKIGYLNGLSKGELKKVLKADPALHHALSQFSMENSSTHKSKPTEHTEDSDSGFSNMGRRSIMNEGNTCYLNSALQAMRNSLYYAHDLSVGPFGKKLKNFYEGREKSLVNTLERELGSNLRKQSDSAEYFNKMCKLLESEGSSEILDKIKLKNNIVTWECSNCQARTDDTRGSRVAAYSLALNEPGHTKEALAKSLHYERDRTCKECQQEVLHHGHKHFEVQHLTIVASDPYVQKLKVDLSFDLDNARYELLSAVLHSGGIHGGHYIALVKDESGGWSSCNDSLVQKVPSSELKSFLSRWTTTQVIYKVHQKSAPAPVEKVAEPESEGVVPPSEPEAPPSTEREGEEVEEVEKEEEKQEKGTGKTELDDGIKTIEDEDHQMHVDGPVENENDTSYCNV